MTQPAATHQIRQLEKEIRLGLLAVRPLEPKLERVPTGSCVSGSGSAPG